MAKDNSKTQVANSKRAQPKKAENRRTSSKPTKKNLSKSTVKATKNNGKNKINKKNSTNGLDWISKLAAKATSDKSQEIVFSKQERKNRRNDKKQRREERIRQRNKDKNGIDTDSSSRHVENADNQTIEHRRKVTMYFLQKLSDRIEQVVDQVHAEEDENENVKKKRRYIKPYVSQEDSIRGKATTGQQLTDRIIQPRKRDYGGLGLARPSILLNLRDDSFIPKLNEEFAEHVHGFFGKQRTKAMKKQLDGDMLWRRLLDKKQNNNSGNKKLDSVKVDGKKLTDMSPDERVEAMIKLDML